MALVACGDDGDSDSNRGPGSQDSCGNEAFTACGGEVEGLWTLRTGCYYAEAPQPWGDEEACQEVPSSFSVTYTRATWEFRADGTVSMQMAVKIEETAYFDDACLLEGSASPDPAQACHEWEGSITGEDDAVIGHNACEYSGGICTCVGSMNETEQPEQSGPYEIVGNEVRLGGAPAGSPFCRSGDVLEIQTELPQGVMHMVFERSL